MSEKQEQKEIHQLKQLSDIEAEEILTYVKQCNESLELFNDIVRTVLRKATPKLSYDLSKKLKLEHY